MMRPGSLPTGMYRSIAAVDGFITAMEFPRLAPSDPGILAYSRRETGSHARALAFIGTTLIVICGRTYTGHGSADIPSMDTPTETTPGCVPYAWPDGSTS